MDQLDNYTDLNWFWDINLHTGKRWYIETEDIWNYRAQLTKEIKEQIIPKKYGKPFSLSPFQVKKITNLDKLKELILREMELLVYSGVSRQHQILGAMYVLTGFVIINPKAAEVMPWLLQ